MKRYILTGAPGSGKTLILRQLETQGYGVVEEAATDLIALWQARGIPEPWQQGFFIDAIAELQWQRQTRAAVEPVAIQFHDRSPVCTAALATYLARPVSEGLARELNRIQADSIFEKQVFFVRNLGFIKNTEARRISFEDTLRFERIHEEVYRSLGFELVFIEPGSVTDRAAAIVRTLSRFNAGQM
ncbi:MAG TPA: AAA family ATPase [Terracidiphilus sp.]|nr:AAA family ATPase [Terracidiphilus sp.]